MATTARAAVQVADRTFEIREFDLPEISTDDALLRVDAGGLCGSDVEQYDGELASLGVTYPLIPGHEPLGTIVEIGEGAARRWGVEAGDRVAVEPVFGCGSCRTCLVGDYRRCRRAAPPGAIASAYGAIPLAIEPSLWGGFAEYLYLGPRTVLHKLGAGLPFELAALYQPMAAAIRWCAHDSGIKVGDTALILGAGQRGLCSVVAARAAGAENVIVTGLARDAHKLALARELGADATIVVDQEDMVAAVRDLTGGEGPDVTIDLTPVATQPIADAIEAAKPGGTIVLAGLKGSASTMPEFSPDRVVMKELTLKGVFAQDIRAFEPALRLIESRKYPLEKLHTHTFGLDDVALAIETLAGRVPGEDAVHVMLAPHGNGAVAGGA
ncbi:zinc-dependent alcohol dehydrogenase [Amycolatopsis jejuensis]|uniref:zinc-dependent alcohol dehydrogenase n=1 Tax=Amycolatopsis jejuensis TaxID=330084 RepID=UPI000524A5B5|nr:zinc-binding dehydrogenase [Amycolatopsis jejuensis]